MSTPKNNDRVEAEYDYWSQLQVQTLNRSSLFYSGGVGEVVYVSTKRNNENEVTSIPSASCLAEGNRCDHHTGYAAMR